MMRMLEKTRMRKMRNLLKLQMGLGSGIALMSRLIGCMMPYVLLIDIADDRSKNPRG